MNDEEAVKTESRSRLFVIERYVGVVSIRAVLLRVSLRRRELCAPRRKEEKSPGGRGSKGGGLKGESGGVSVS